MGSDAIKKSLKAHFRTPTQNLSLYRSVLLFLLTLVIIIVFLFQETAQGKRPKLRRAHEIINRTIPKWEMDTAREDLPRQCFSLLEQLNQCQSSKETIIFACHRKWCSSSYGHCEEVNGIGDRTQRMLSMVTDAIDKCTRVEFDYPQTRNGIDLRFPTSLEYRDPWGLISEFFHFRSYDVSDHFVNVDSWGKLGESNQVHRTFAHFTPMGYKWHHYDPCLYHILFRKTDDLNTELAYYEDLFRLKEGNTVGIHFRTGDLTAFGVKNNDIRAQGESLESSYNKMVACAEKLAENLNLSRGSFNKLNFFLATDNQHVKDMANNDKRYDIHMTEETPSSYLMSNGDKTAYLDLYLLSKTKGLSVNVLPAKYDGPAERVSTFARLAWNIGFMNNEQLHECEIG
eukprot:scaffold248_cov263-Chaetoceros_neogracile.AAC.29